MFDILSLSGSFTPDTISGGASSSRVGSLSITLAQPDGHVVGGLLAGLLIAASPVQVKLFPILTFQKPVILVTLPLLLTCLSFCWFSLAKMFS